MQSKCFSVPCGIWTVFISIFMSRFPEYAEEQADRLEAGIFSLEEYPYSCAERKTGRYANRGYRELIVDSYIIIYKIHERKKEVDIVTVQHGKRNL